MIVLVVVLAALPRVWTAVTDQGVIWPDEIYQSVENAHRVAFGYGFTPWEFDEGARSYLFPGVIAGLWKLCDLLGIDSALNLMRAAKLLIVAFALAGVALAVAHARRLAGPTAGIIAAGLTLAYPLCLLYGSRTFSEAVAAPLILAAVAVTVPYRQTTRLALAAGAAGGIAVTLRPQNAIVVAIVVVGLLVTRERGRAVRYVAGAGGAFLVGGLLDWITWGTPFASTWRIVEFNLFDEARAAYGSEPIHFYLKTLVTGSGPVVALVVVGLIAAARKAPIGVAVVVGYLLVHSLVHHKELRYAYPVIPLALVLAAVGLAQLIDWAVARAATASRRETHRSWAALGTSGLAVALSVAWLPGLTFDRIGEAKRAITETQESVWNHSEGFNRMLVAAGQRSETCGVGVVMRIPDQSILFLGGYSYFHRDVPLYNVYVEDLADVQGQHLAGVNMLIADEGVADPAGFQTVAESGDVRLLERPGPCGPPSPDFVTVFPK